MTPTAAALRRCVLRPLREESLQRARGKTNAARTSVNRSLHSRQCRCFAVRPGEVSALPRLELARSATGGAAGAYWIDESRVARVGERITRRANDHVSKPQRGSRIRRHRLPPRTRAHPAAPHRAVRRFRASPWSGVSLDEGLRECSCSWVDVDALEYVALRALNARALEFRALPVPHDAAGNLAFPNDPDLTVERWIRQL